MKICVLEDVPWMVLLLKDALPLMEIPFVICYEASTLFTALRTNKEVLMSEKFTLLVIGSHPATKFSWRDVVYHMKREYPHLPILIISADANVETHRQVFVSQNIAMLNEPFKIRDLYNAICTMSTSHL